MPLHSDVITHNYDPSRGIAKNICDLEIPEAERILDQIRAQGYRRLSPNYLQRRLQTEEWLIDERNKKLGRTKLHRPIYFFLGNFADGKDKSRPASLVMPLRLFHPESLTFTFLDSMSSFAKQRDKGVHTLDDEIKTMVQLGKKSDSGFAGENFIEVQVWDDGPIVKYLSEL